MTDLVDRIVALPADRRAEFTARLPPLSSQQQQLWLRQQLEPDSALFNVQTALRAKGPLDLALFKQALEAVVAANAILRTNLIEIDGTPYQIVRAEAQFDWIHADLMQEREPDQVALERVRAALTRPFDLARDPALRICAFATGPDEHVLAIVAHHVTFDAQAVRLFLAQVAEAYGRIAQRIGAEVTDTQPALQYADFATWQRDRIGEESRRDLAWWADAMRDCPDPLDIPVDYARTAKRGLGGRSSRQVPPVVCDALDDVRTRAGATRFVVFVTAWAELLGRYSATDAVCIGTPVSGRTQRALEQVIGNFVSDVPLLIRNDPATSLLERLRQVRDVVTGAFAHQSVPLARIAEAVGQRPDALYQTLVNMVTIPSGLTAPEVRLGQVRLAQIDEIAPPGAMNDISLVIHDLPNGLFVHLDYDGGLLSASSAEQMLDNLLNLLSAAIQHPDLPLAGVPMTSAAETAAIQHFGRGERIAVPSAMIHELVAAQAALTPAATALIDGEQRMTYAELDGRANALAVLLAARGVGPEHFVFTVLPESLDVVVAWLAILKAGAAFVPLDHEAPPQRNLAMLAQCPNSLVLSTSVHVAPLGLPDDCWLDVAGLAETAAVFVGPQVQSDNPIYAMFTSGSTGQPKGVVVTHGGIMNRLAWMSHHFPRDCADRVLKTTRHLFDSAIWQIFWPLSVGGTAVIIDAAFPEGIRPVLAAIRTHSITAVDFVPSNFSAMIEELERDQTGVEITLPSLRLAVFGGEQVTRDGVDWFHQHSAAQVYNLYGPTEASIGCIYRPLARDYDGFIPIGKPIANTDVLLLDGQDRAVPAGVQGEICLIGACLARGYLGQPGTTATAFTPTSEGARLYRTGDLGRWTPSGDLVFIGRRDHQVKIRGFRIELGEIEALLLAHGGVARAVVILAGAEASKQRLLAYVVGDQLDGNGLRQYLRERLAAHMVPAQITVLETLPLLANGKLDRRALPIPEQGATGPSAELPLAGAETTIATIIGDVLGIDQLGRHDNYFDLGGDSIQAIRIAARARQVGLVLPASKIFTGQTVAVMATLVSDLHPAPAAELPENPFVLTPIQQRYVSRSATPGRMCHTVVLETGSELHPAALSLALTALIKCHPALNLRLTRNADGTWLQQFGRGAPVCGFSDLSVLPAKRREAAFRARVETLRGDLDMISGPSLQMELFACGSGPRRLAVIVHHMCVDAVSWNILVEDLQLTLAQQAQGQAPPLPPTNCSYQTYATRLAERAHLPSEKLAANWWTQDDWSAVAEHSAALIAASAVQRIGRSITLSVAVTRALTDRSYAHFKAQAGEVLLGCIVAALARARVEPVLAIALETHGRDAVPELATERTVGWFTSYFPVLFQVPPTGTTEQLIRTVIARLQTVPDNGVPFATGRYLRNEPALAAIPEPSVSFNFLGRIDAVLNDSSQFKLITAGAPWRNLDEGGPGRPLDINASIVAEQLGIHLVWDANWLEQIAAGRLIAALEEILADVAKLLSGVATELADEPDFEFLNVI